MLKIGQIGCGTVGSGVYRILNDNRQLIASRTGCEIVVKRIAVRDLADPRYVEVPPEMLTTDAGEILDDPEIDIVVEVMGGLEPARSFILRAIENSKHVVTANKELMSTHGGELLTEAESRGVAIAFEASVGGGIPIVHPLKEGLAGNTIHQVLGIVNGTTNYVLSRMSEEGLPFELALRQAQELGYAEADPSADIEGRDAAAKLAILASIAFNVRIRLADVYTEGISRITTDDIYFARELGYVIKLLAIAKNEEDGISVRVHPTMIPQDHPLASVKDVFNAIFVSGDAVGDLMFYGQGAGSLPAASAVVGDIIYAARHLLFGGRGVGCTCFDSRPIKDMEETISRYYMLFDVPDRPGVLAQIAGVFGANQVSIKSVIQHGTGQQARIVLITHTVKEKAIRDTIRGLEALPVINQISSVIRVEESEGE
jgi:homoserine dehydrogenase